MSNWKSNFSILFRTETDRNSFSFSLPKVAIFDGFGHFRFRLKTH